jgi:2-phosphosulfolactate phosphatase
MEMNADVVLLPRELPDLPADRVVVVFDVLRATTTIAAALAAGVAEIRIFDDLDSARSAAQRHDGPRLLCGEQRCLPPAGFDMGNSPGQFTAKHAGQTVFMATTNGTRAIVTAQQADIVLIGALVNAPAVARVLVQLGKHFTLLCAGTDGAVAMEDLLGAGAVLDAVRQTTSVHLESDVARIAVRLFHATRDQLRPALAQSRGGQNVIRAALDADIDFASRVGVLDVVGVARSDPLRVVKWH